MSSAQRTDDFQARRARLRGMSDAELHEHFWHLVDQIVAPLIAEARTHTSPSIERSVLLRMGFSSVECKQLVEQMRGYGLLGHGAGRLVFELAKAKGVGVREAGEALLAGKHWQELSQ
ncbi:MAG: ornithine aminomutase [Gammaproteobacteria bacterium SG8_47]|nr:MAG: ornithine aminomutase [Gammaproteobacteria bacterium SG8_47]